MVSRSGHNPLPEQYGERRACRFGEKWHLFLIVAIVVLYALPGVLSAETIEKDHTGRTTREKYRYEALPGGEHESSEREAVEIEVISGEEGMEYISRATSADVREEIRIVMDRKRRFVSALREKTDASKKKVQRGRIWVKGQTLYLERDATVTGEIKDYHIPEDRHMAVDGALLMLLRSFPFGEGKEWKVFMVDFSGHSVTVTVRQAGMESVATPAGEFECYRMEAIVNMPIIRPRIIYWLTKGEPHFLVKQEGKRGPFTPSYVTSLIAVE